MFATKILVVDDSLTMRAFISGVLERIGGVEVVGAADGVAEARLLVDSLRPDVMTLDVEMPGMNGIQYLAEIMETRPMPVIMFSARTTAGAAESVEALRLGAIDCFPKPRKAELDAIIAKLGKRIKAAKYAELKTSKPKAPSKTPSIDWNGRILAIGADASSTRRLFDLFATFPPNCPPTLVVQHLGPGLVDSMVAKMAEQVAPKVVVASDGMAIEQGTIYFAPQGDDHLVVSAWPDGKLHLIPRDPVAGERPSISRLFASVGNAAAARAVGLLMLHGSEDGSGGTEALAAAGGYVISRAAGGGYTLSRGLASQPLATDALSAGIIKLCSR